MGSSESKDVPRIEGNVVKRTCDGTYVCGNKVTVHGNYNRVCGNWIKVYGHFNILEGNWAKAWGKGNRLSGNFSTDHGMPDPTTGLYRGGSSLKFQLPSVPTGPCPWNAPKKVPAPFGRGQRPVINPLPAAAPPPPPGQYSRWARVQDPASGRDYFVDRETGATSWTDPSQPVPAPPLGAAAVDMLPTAIPIVGKAAFQKAISLGDDDDAAPAAASAPPAAKMGVSYQQPPPPQQQQRQQQVMHVVIPVGLEPGQVFQVQAGGRLVNATVPAGCHGGSTIQLLL